MKTLFIAWQDKGPSRTWYPIGRLDADVESSSYRFRYLGGAKRAEKEARFPPLANFPKLDRDYHSSELFSLFKNRVMWPSRPDFGDYLRSLALTEGATPIDMLAVSGGHRATDSYEVFPKLAKDESGNFACRFFLHGGKHVNEAAQRRLDCLKEGEQLYAAVELTNLLGELALQVQTIDYHMIGWAPRYLVDDLVMAMAESPGEYSTMVVRVNPMPAPSSQRVLIELRGKWSEHEPMSGPDYQPLVGEP